MLLSHDMNSFILVCTHNWDLSHQCDSYQATLKSLYKQHVDFLFIWWFWWDLDHRAGWQAWQLHQVGFLDAEQPGTFGFLDPAVVIQGVHMIPEFAYGTCTDLLSPPQSVAQLPSTKFKIGAAMLACGYSASSITMKFLIF